MSSVQHLREFISERLTAAAEEIFTEFEKTIVQYEEEMDRQRRLLDITWKPQINLHTAEVPHQYFCKEEKAFQADQQLCNQKSNSNLDQGRPESAHIKEEEEENLSPSQDGEQLLLKDETDSCSIAAAHDENGQRDPEPNSNHIPTCTSPEDEHSHLEGSVVEDSGPTGCADMKPNKSFQRKGNNNVGNSVMLESHSNTRHKDEKLDISCKSGNKQSSFEKHAKVHKNKEQYSCKTCGKRFKDKTKFTRHVRTHTGEKPYSCTTCGQRFTFNSNLVSHMRTHTGEKPYSCTTCGKCFSQKQSLLGHIRTHTGEKPYSCTTCGQRFTFSSYLVSHMRTHTGEKPHSCTTCGKCFSRNWDLLRHIRTHTGEKPYSCKTCGQRFTYNTYLLSHMRTHTVEKPYSCKTCGQQFSQKSSLDGHTKTHTAERPFSCKVCGKCFRHNSYLLRHANSHR